MTPTRQTPNLTQDIIKGHFQRPELGTSKGPDIVEPVNERQKLMKSVDLVSRSQHEKVWSI